jgi:hypothetical protein
MKPIISGCGTNGVSGCGTNIYSTSQNRNSEKIPAAVVVPIVVEKLILLIVFPCTSEVPIVPTVISIPLYEVLEPE